MIEQVRWYTHDDDSCVFEAAGYEISFHEGWWTAFRYHDNSVSVLGSTGGLMAAKAIVERDIAARRTEMTR